MMHAPLTLGCFLLVRLFMYPFLCEQGTSLLICVFDVGGGAAPAAELVLTLAQ